MLRLREDRRPLSSRVRDQVWEMLQGDDYGEGAQLPAESVIATTLGVSRSTVREALRLLEDERVVLVRNGVGRFVAHSPTDALHEELTHLKSTTELMRAIGGNVTTQVLSVELGRPDESVCQHLGLDEDAKVVTVERSRLLKGEPVIYSIDRFAQRIVKGSLQQKRFAGSLFQLMEEQWGIRISYTKALLNATILDKKLAKRLGTSPSQAWVVMNQVHYDAKDRPVLYSQDFYRGDKITFNVLRRRR